MEDRFPGEKQAESISHADEEAGSRKTKKGKQRGQEPEGKEKTLDSKGPGCILGCLVLSWSLPD